METLILLSYILIYCSRCLSLCTLVAANITKLLETNAEKLTFALVRMWNFAIRKFSILLSCTVQQSTGTRQPVEKGVEKKLIGYAQLSVIGSTMGSTV